jgi:2-C-methyl-D-erythritol 4-phosphate cytidylyltransferase
LDNRFSFILAGGGTSERFGRDKLWIPIHGRPVLFHSLKMFLGHPGLVSGNVTLSRNDFKSKKALLKKYLPSTFRVIPGGPTRALSVHRAFCELNPADDELVVIHDAARPCVTRDILNRALKLAEKKDAVIVGIPVRDTLKAVAGNRVSGTAPRAGMIQEQTPLIFRASLLRRAYALPRKEWKDLTDEAQMLEGMGLPVSWSMGSVENLKLTYPEDLPLIKAILTR